MWPSNRFGGTGAGVAEAMQPFADEAAHHRFEEMKPWGARSSSRHSFNWKLFAENDAEGYHIPSGHPGLRRLFGGSYSDATPSCTPSSVSKTLTMVPA